MRGNLKVRIWPAWKCPRLPCGCSHPDTPTLTLATSRCAFGPPGSLIIAVPILAHLPAPLAQSSIADLVNAAEGQGGAITAALYLQAFVTPRRGSGSGGSSGSSGGSGSAAGGDGEVAAPAVAAEASVAVDGESEGKGAGKGAKEGPVWVHFDMPGSTMGLRTAFAFVKDVAAGASQ